MNHGPEHADRLHRFAHDLRNRLIGMQQVVERLAEGPDPEEKAEFLRFGEHQFFSALREVEKLLDDLGVERGTVVPDRKPLHMAALIRDRLAAIAYRFDRKGQQVIVQVHGPDRVMGDERILGGIVDALLSNASKFSEKGQEIQLAIRNHGTHMEVLVTDHGEGLSAADLAQVFVRYAMLASRPTQGEAQGRGTLARMHAWAQAHGGALVASSPGVGAGCTFRLRIPVT